MATLPDEDGLLRSVALQNAQSILHARQRAEEELLRAREALGQSEERLKAALSAAGTGTFRWDFESGDVQWDGNLDRLFGLEGGPGSRSFDTFIHAVHPDDRDAVAAASAKAMRDGADFDMEFRVVWPDGSVHWIHDKARTCRDERDRPAYMTGACADVTSRREAAEAQRRNEERLRAMFNQAAVGIAIADLDGRLADVNAKFAEIVGYPEAEIRQRTFLDITHPDDVAETREAMQALLAGTAAASSMEKRYVRRDGSIVWSLTIVTVLRDDGGRPQQLIGVIEDITARIEAETALREETRVLELLNETGKTLASQLDLEAVIQAVTDAGRGLSGAAMGAFFYNTVDDNGESYLLYTLSGVSRDAFERFGMPRATALFGPTFRGESPIRVDDVLADSRYGTMAPHHGMPKGHPPVRSYLAVPVRARSGEVIGGLFFGHPRPSVFNERTERLIVGLAAQAGIAFDTARLFEAAQNAAEERQVLLDSERMARGEAERMSTVKDEFLATLSHELRTPLNAILGWSQILRNGKGRQDVLRGLEVIERNARAQTQLIEDLLDMSRITSGTLRLDVQPVSPVTFVEAAIETLKPAFDAKGIRLETFLDPSTGPIAGDPGRLQQVVWNLLSNGVKFTPKGGKVQLVLQRVNSQIEIQVADTGAGIRPEFLPYLFERFRQGDHSTTRKHGGLGLGLSIVKSLVELHGGGVEAVSPGEGQGTTVTVSLPLLAVYQQADAGGRVHPGSEAPSQAPAAPSRELEGIRVLVVDDQPDARDLLTRVLEDGGAEVVAASSGEEALARIAEQAPDVLLSDIGMPEMDGFELLRRVRRLSPAPVGRTPAIALTAFSRSEDRTRALRAGFVVHVTKPVDPSELVATVASVAGRLTPPH
jgi:PAS domain S-box-containing protein